MFKREVNQNFLKIKEDYKEAFPKEMTENPYEKFRLKQDVPIDVNLEDQTTGAQLMKTIMEERRRLRDKKLQKMSDKDI